MLTDFWHDVTSFGSLVVSLVLIVGAYTLGQPHLAAQLSITLVLCYLISFPIKVFFFKRRPNNQQYATLLQKFDAASFPSVHSMRAVGHSIVLASFAQSMLFTSFAILIVLGVLYTRIALQKHYVVDVIAGALIGAAIGFAVVHYDVAAYVLNLFG